MPPTTPNLRTTPAKLPHSRLAASRPLRLVPVKGAVLECGRDAGEAPSTIADGERSFDASV
jgi:hypothetical protein